VEEEELSENWLTQVHPSRNLSSSSSSSSSSKQLAMAPLNRCSAAPYKQYSIYNVGYVYIVT